MAIYESSAAVKRFSFIAIEETHYNKATLTEVIRI